MQILPASAWREFRGPAASKGQNHTTHQALIADQHGQEHKCYVKASPQGSPMPFAEAAAWLIAEALDLPRPKFAAVISLPVQKLRQSMPLDQHWTHYTEVLAFCASSVDGKHITHPWRWLAHIRAAKAFKNADVARIAAFDAWVENQDRHSGNFLRTRKGDYVPIDNELILYTLLWVASGLTYVHNSLRMQAKDILTSRGYLKFEGSMVVAANRHETALTSAWPSLQRLIAAMVPDPARQVALTGDILQFLSQRAHPDWLANELGRIS